MKIGVMNNPRVSLSDQIIAFGEAEFDFIDLTIEGPAALTPDVKKLKILLEQFNLSVVGHTDPALPYAYPIAGVRQACLVELERCARLFHNLGARIMNIHPCYACPPGMRNEILTLNSEALVDIQRMAAAHELTLVLENFVTPFDSVSVFSLILQQVPGLQVHLDFGHANLGRDDGVTFCQFLGQDIKHVHFSDNRGTADHHMPLGVGNIDWLQSVQALQSIGYEGTITLEVFCDDRSMLPQYLEISRQFVRDLWDKDPPSHKQRFADDKNRL
ncbi:sugar phosphate isomerase/epimerase family protein [candidate division CSSED10-310 bacterium]|uniref:Sugar phosphate isomerase/epimerase family protein n=1 Tax=candidate division CSSED10-310 bacterium TaxID=2855610 RepID=A0ABV6YVI2_UNCC1